MDPFSLPDPDTLPAVRQRWVVERIGVRAAYALLAVGTLASLTLQQALDRGLGAPALLTLLSGVGPAGAIAVLVWRQRRGRAVHRAVGERLGLSPEAGLGLPPWANATVAARAACGPPSSPPSP
ncbi:MAG: hypothetical protein R3F59_22920 [Myxococcota bacterium]